MPDRLHEEDLSLIAERVSSTLAEKMLSDFTIPSARHYEDHLFIEAWIAEQKRKQERWETLKATIAGGVLTAAIIACGSWLLGKKINLS